MVHSSYYSGDLEQETTKDSFQQHTGEVLTEGSIHEPQLNVGGHGGTQRRLRDYQVTMIGFCSGIGTGLFIGTGSAYANAGPAGLLLAYIIVGFVLWCVMQSISELATVVSTTSLYDWRSVSS
jgi:amino acid transporter